MRRIFHQKWWMIALEVVGVVLLLFVGLVIAVAVTSPPLPQTKATATQVPTTEPTRVPTPTPTLVPTVAPTAVPTKAPQVVPTPTVAPSPGGAVLGALLGPFVAKFGQPNSCSNPPLYVFRPCGNGPSAGVDVLTVGGSPDQNRVQSITDQGPQAQGEGWDVSTARAVCLSFLPPDAQYQKRTDEATTTGTGFVLRYYSATIAQEFTPDQFSDGNGNTTPPGIFEVAFVYGNGSPTLTSQVAWCDMTIGEQGWQSF
jgi:hypothetical protein